MRAHEIRWVDARNVLERATAEDRLVHRLEVGPLALPLVRRAVDVAVRWVVAALVLLAVVGCSLGLVAVVDVDAERARVERELPLGVAEASFSSRRPLDVRLLRRRRDLDLHRDRGDAVVARHNLLLHHVDVELALLERLLVVLLLGHERAVDGAPAVAVVPVLLDDGVVVVAPDRGRVLEWLSRWRRLRHDVVEYVDDLAAVDGERGALEAVGAR